MSAASTADTTATTKLSNDEINWAIAAHASSFMGAWLALGVIGPLCVYILKGERSPFVRAHAVESVNFNINALAAIAISGILTPILIGYFLLLGVAVAYAYFVIRGALAARKGKPSHYPCVFRLMK